MHGKFLIGQNVILNIWLELHARKINVRYTINMPVAAKRICVYTGNTMRGIYLSGSNQSY
jgi:hypothetical protein